MQIIYRIYNEWTPAQLEVLRHFNYFPKLVYDSIDIPENEDNLTLLRFIDDWRLEKFVGTKYNTKDIEESKSLMFVGCWTNGYPRPESISGYLNATYNLDLFCENCGIGAVQDAPFRLARPPKWNNRLLFELGWVFDEIFARKTFYEEFLKNEFALDSRPVVLHKNRSEIDDTVQLVIPKSQIALTMTDTPFTICEKCHRKRYTPQVKGFLPSFESENPYPLVKSMEYFGSGGGANNRIFMSKYFYKKLKEKKIRITAWPSK
jgi:hypothetical protein